MEKKVRIRSPSSSSSSSSSSPSNALLKRIKIVIKRSTNEIIKRNPESERRISKPSTESQSQSRISRNNRNVNECLSNRNQRQQIEKYIPCLSTNKSPLTTTPSTSTYWKVTDREPEWFKLSIPLKETLVNKKQDVVPYRILPSSLNKEQFKSNNKNRINRPIDTIQLTMKSMMNELDYDMDDDDLKFLNELNQFNKANGKEPFSEDEFENAIIILEFFTAEKIRSYLKQKSCEDDNIVCDICLLPDADFENEMVFCERCNTCVHQHCYGISVVPSGTWLCRSCSILRQPYCILCPKIGGPMKCTASGTIWCHLTCALWLPELKFADYNKMEPILHLNNIPHGRWSLRCVVCSTSKGACVQCAHKNCRTPFHVTCGLAAGYFLDIQQISSKETNTTRSQFNAYCSKHSNEARKNSDKETSRIETNQTTNNDPLPIPLTVYRRNQLKHELWNDECHKKFSTFISSSHLHDECPKRFDEHTSKEIYNYWINKRQMNKTMPLIKRIDYVLEQRENSDLLISQINACLHIRTDMINLQNRCKSMLNSSSNLNERLENLKDQFSLSNNQQSGRRRGRSSMELNSIRNNKKHCREQVHVPEPCEKLLNDRQCVVLLESAYRHDLQLNTTYLIRKTIDGKIILVPKQLMEQIDIITKADNYNHEKRQTTIMSSVDSDISDDDQNTETSKEKKLFQAIKSPYTSDGNIVTCVTGSFH